MAKIPETLLAFANPAEWRAWLEAHHATEREAWLRHYRKQVGRPGLSYEQGVEEALCFGWIQSRLKPLDPQRFAVRFSPRHKGSIWSLPNLKRVHRLIAQGRMTEAGMAVLPPDFD